MLTVDQLTGDIAMDRGDYFDPIFTIVDAAGNPLDVTGATFKLTVKQDVDDDISIAVFQLSTATSDFDVTGQVNGIIKAKGAESLSLSLDGNYVYDLEMVLSLKTRTVQPQAKLYVNKDVTTPGSAPSPPSVLVPFPGDVQVMGGQIYIKDTGTGANAGKYWKLVVQDGVFDIQGPSVTVPF